MAQAPMASRFRPVLAVVVAAAVAVVLTSAVPHRLFVSNKMSPCRAQEPAVSKAASAPVLDVSAPRQGLEAQPGAAAAERASTPLSSLANVGQLAAKAWLIYDVSALFILSIAGIARRAERSSKK
eukprot:gb/GFBE01076278.1/.p1 GENE.gb/GFBE01076278.1/~~gb/GFBE01076278.1/.p1  ORF type:complete len:125 (+),score=27.61 gb/GFBE01076278.1/:1-375(+)